MSFWGSAGFATYEWTLSSRGDLTVLVASVDEDVESAFLAFARDYPKFTKYPLLFDFVLCTERLRYLEHVVIAYVQRIETRGVSVEPNVSIDAIEDTERSTSSIFTLHEWVFMIEPLLDQMERCERLLAQRPDAAVWEKLALQVHAAVGVDLHQLREKHKLCRKKIDNVVGRAQMQLSLVSSSPGKARLPSANIDDY